MMKLKDVVTETNKKLKDFDDPRTSRIDNLKNQLVILRTKQSQLDNKILELKQKKISGDTQIRKIEEEIRTLKDEQDKFKELRMPDQKHANN